MELIPDINSVHKFVAMPLSISSKGSAAESLVSQTSTTEYDQEPFETYKDRVKELCTSLWPSKEITIERMHGGSFNRVIGVAVSTTGILEEKKSSVKEYVLRIPRESVLRIEPELATLCFVRKNTPIPVPEIILFDPTQDNPLSSKYNIQLRISGDMLMDVYMTLLSHTDRLSIIRQVAQILLEMHKIRSPVPGLLDAAKLIPRNEVEKLAPGIRIVDFVSNTFLDSSGETRFGGMEDDSAKPKSLFQLLIDQFDGLQAWGRRWHRDDYEAPFMERFRTIARQMEQLGFLEGDEFFLCHTDFFPRNIMVSKEELGWKISGILDWDKAAFTPYSVACRPPTWIWDKWDEDSDNERDEAFYCKMPDDPEARERKELFDSLMGVPYTDHAYSDHNTQFVRRIYDFAMEGFNDAEQYKHAAKFFKEWDKAFDTNTEVESISGTETSMEVGIATEVETTDGETTTDAEDTTNVGTITGIKAALKFWKETLKKIKICSRAFWAKLREYCIIQ